MRISSGVADPFGGTSASAIVNGGQARQGLRQSLPVPGWFQYCVSAYARSAGGASIYLERSNASGADTKAIQLDATWRQVTSSGALSGNDTSVTFAIELDAGGSIELFGTQAEAQPTPSAYMETGDTGGVYANARFNTDRLTVTAQSIGRSDTELRIVAPDGV